MKDITTEEALNELKERLQTLKRHTKNYEQSKCETNIYNQLKKEATAIEKVIKELNKKDKIINAMALQLSGITIWDNKKEEPLILKTEEEVKKYYEGNVENDYEENYKSISNN